MGVSVTFEARITAQARTESAKNTNGTELLLVTINRRGITMVPRDRQRLNENVNSLNSKIHTTGTATSASLHSSQARTLQACGVQPQTSSRSRKA